MPAAHAGAGLKKYPLMRGIRQQLHWHENPLYRFAPHPPRSSPADPSFAARTLPASPITAGRLTCRSLRRRWRMQPVLPRACPDVTFVHPDACRYAGRYVTRRPVKAEWRKGMKQACRLRQTFSPSCPAFGTFIHKQRPGVHRLHDQARRLKTSSRAERCMFGSNFPIEKTLDHLRRSF